MMVQLQLFCITRYLLRRDPVCLDPLLGLSSYCLFLNLTILQHSSTRKRLYSSTFFFFLFFFRRAATADKSWHVRERAKLGLHACEYMFALTFLSFVSVFLFNSFVDGKFQRMLICIYQFAAELGTIPFLAS